MTGITAWIGLFRTARLQDGETVFISGGAGAVGMAACQLAKMHGCRVLASAGTEDKVAFLRDELKVDYAFNYRDGEPFTHLKAGAPEGLHVYFDNTAGPQLEAALFALRNHGRVAMCGGIAGYNTAVPGPRNMTLVIGKRLRLEGFLVIDWMKEMPAFYAEAIPALKSGKLINRETVVEGLDAAPAAFIDLLHSRSEQYREDGGEANGSGLRTHPTYSSRSTCMGSVRDARQAGSSAATPATTNIRHRTPANVTASKLDTP